MPGVSIRQAPDGSGSSARWVVVWRPRESVARTAAVRIFCTPSKVLVRVDLPAPDEPTSTAVCPGPSHGRSASTLSAWRALTVSSGIACAASSSSTASASSAYSVRSALVSTTTGAAPPPPTSSR
ncbi:hypothetical protein NB706_003730 [Xanthomonas sacchari]|nr:hypothetical protein [Xanthomonas sacchari]